MFKFNRRTENAPSQEAWLNFQLLSVIAGNRRSSAVGNVINALILAIVFAATVPTTLIAAALILLFTLLGWRLLVLARLKQIEHEPAALLKTARAIEIGAVLLGLWWGVATGSLMFLARGDQHMFLGIMAAGMMGAGAISFRSLRRAAQVYISACALGALAGFLSMDSTASLAACCLTVCYWIVLRANIITNSNDIIRQFVQQRDAEVAADTIKLLLNDFTEQGSDWLFELDSNGRLVDPSDRLAQALERPVQTLKGKIFLDLFDESEDSRAFAEHLENGRAFRRCILPLTVAGECRWWSISARPTSGGTFAYRGVITDITAQRHAEEKVSYMAHYDGLTDLPNRFLFNESLYRAFNRRSDHIGLMYLDLDNFKSINDTLGHPIGDQLLKAAGKRIEACVTASEMVARLGGDEFAILVGARNVGRTEEMAAKIVESLGRPFELNGHNVVVGASIGIACGPEHGANAEKLLQNADLALYAAKSQGRNRFATFEPGMDEAAIARRLLELDLRSSLGNDEMRLYYQSVIDIKTGEISGYEALIRWEHSERGFVMPDLFIPIAEETGLIVQIGEWVIRQALRDLASWDEKLTVSINLSPAQMRSPSLVTTVINALAENNLDPARICLEITETVLMQDSEANIETLHKLSALGLQIALDDFGTGYSSLNYLRSFPFNKIKIDRCFVEDIDTREDCRAIVRSVVSLASSLGMTTTAEGVERQEQFDQLRTEGCGEVQGFLYSKAVPVDELTNLRMPSHTNKTVIAQLERARIKRLEAESARQFAEGEPDGARAAG